MVFKGEEEVCEVTPHSEAADPRSTPTYGGKPIVSDVQRNKVVSLPRAATAASPNFHGLVGVLKLQQKRASGIIKHNTNAVKNLAATQAFPGDNVDEAAARSPRPRRPSSPPSRRMECRPGAGAVLGSGRAVGRSGRGLAARPPWQQ
eukprot:jgi/Tetstr1/437291/TSEL_002775.t1